MLTPAHRRNLLLTVLFVAAYTLPQLAFAASLAGPQNPTYHNPAGVAPIALSAEMFRERMARIANDPGLASRRVGKGVATGTLNLFGEIAGTWENVDAYLVYTQDFTALAPAIGRLQVLLRGYKAEREGASNRYHIGWDRRIYWLKFAGAGAGVPHLLGALEFASTYVPDASDPYPEFNANPAVLAQCTALNPCALNWSPYVLYRDPNTDYSSYPEGAAESDLLFVSNSVGDVIAVSLDLYNAQGAAAGRTPLRQGDALRLSTIGYKLTEPGFVYVISYMNFETLASGFVVERQHYIPGTDFIDPNLPPDLNAGTRTIKLLLEATNGTGANTVFAFGGPFDLGFNWASAPDFLFRGNMESLMSSPN